MIYYRHGWWRPTRIGKRVWKHIISDFKKIISHLKIKLRGHNYRPEPTITEDCVVFTDWYPNNESQYPQPFWFNKVIRREDFCDDYWEDIKYGYHHTYQTKCGLTVMIFLIIVKHYIGKRLYVDSDNNIKEWYPAVEKCLKILGYGLEEVKQMALNIWLRSHDGLPWWKIHSITDKETQKVIRKLENVSKNRTREEEIHGSFTSTSGGFARTAISPR